MPIELDNAKDIVVYRDDWGALLPEQYPTPSLDLEDRWVMLSTPQRGGHYRLERYEETANERRIFVSGESLGGHALGDLPMEFPFADYETELLRLRNSWREAGGDEAHFDQLARSESRNLATERLRAGLRELGTDTS